MYDVGRQRTKGFQYPKDIFLEKTNLPDHYRQFEYLTSAALTSNREWNTKLISTEQGEMAKEIVAEFKELWNSPYAFII